jgi:hypothetical protein
MIDRFFITGDEVSWVWADAEELNDSRPFYANSGHIYFCNFRRRSPITRGVLYTVRP